MAKLETPIVKQTLTMRLRRTRVLIAKEDGVGKQQML